MEFTQSSIELIEESTISTIKSISSNSKIEVEFELDYPDFCSINQDFFLKNPKISLPKVNNGSQQRIQLIRAFGDLSAAYLAFHRSNTHQKYNPADSAFKGLYDDFEKMRLINKMGREFKGSQSNLAQLIEDNIENYSQDYKSFLPLMLLESKNQQSTKLQDHINLYKKTISPDLIDKVEQLMQLIDQQEAFAQKVCEIIAAFSQKDHQQDNQKRENSEENKAQIEREEENNIVESTLDQQEQENEEAELKDAKIEKRQIVKQQQYGDGESKIDENQPYQEVMLPELDSDKSVIKFIPQYRIFTKKYDKVVAKESLSNKTELNNLRYQLDQKLKKIDKISNALSSKLKRKLLSKKNTSYEHNKEEGALDRKKINQIVTKPLTKNNYVTINQDQYQNTVVTLLLDNSGSMRGMPIVMSAGACETIAKILERFNIKTEILGFTTSDWRGGKSRKDWERLGKPKNPGRLSDLLHIIYKSADQSFKKSRLNLGLMLKEGMLKENIDGEALKWAKDRLLSRSEKRKILIVISDGTPVDDSTNSNNEDNILSDHLHKMINNIEKHSKIEIAAIGIGHNVGDFYHNSITINNIEDLGDVMINKICDLL
ncbi:MAG: hypothetical protein O3B09_01725 [Proteobacteria bacterium]|nr:hypothetical protein [Pseudomonadota bacterium]